MVKVGWWFGLQWTVVTVLAFGASLLWIEVGERPDLGGFEGAIAGGIVGVAQAIVLRQCLSPVWGWVLLSSIAWGILAASGFGAIGWVAPRTDAIALRFIFGLGFGAIGGGWLGIWQWLALRRHIRASWFWIIVSAWCWGMGLALGWTVGGVLRSATHLFLGEVVGLAVTWIAIGTMTGIVLVRFLANGRGPFNPESAKIMTSESPYSE